MHRLRILVLIASLVLDIADPLVPNGFEFDPDEPSQSQVRSRRFLTASAEALDERSLGLDAPTPKPTSMQHSARASHVVSEWLSIRPAHASPAPPPPASEDH